MALTRKKLLLAFMAASAVGGGIGSVGGVALKSVRDRRAAKRMDEDLTRLRLMMVRDGAAVSYDEMMGEPKPEDIKLKKLSEKTRRFADDYLGRRAAWERSMRRHTRRGAAAGAVGGPLTLAALAAMAKRRKQRRRR